MLVYLTRNHLNGKGYVGKTKRGLQQRWKEHVSNAVKGTPARISDVIYGHRATHKGYIWRYVTEGGQSAEQG